MPEKEELSEDVRRIKEKAEREGAESLTMEEMGTLGGHGVELTEEEERAPEDE